MLEHAETIAQIITAVISGAAIIAAATPTVKDDEYVTRAKRWWKTARKVLNVLGANVGNAKNRDED